MLASLLDAVHKYKDVIDIIIGLGVPTGLAWLIWRLIANFRGRIRVEIRDFAFALLQPETVRSVSFRAVNTSNTLTALNRTLVMTGITPKGAKHRYTFEIHAPAAGDVDLRLPPHEERFFVATHGDLKNAAILFLWYARYRWTFTAGPAVSVRILNADRATLGITRFYLGRAIFRGRIYLGSLLAWLRRAARRK